MLGAFALGILVAVLVLPALGGLFGAGENRPALPVLLLTWIAVAAVSGAYLFPISVVLGFPRDWFRFGLSCLAALELILFVLTPLSLSGRNLGPVEYAVVALVSLILALLVFGQIAKAARTGLPPGAWPVKSKVTLAAIAGGAGLLASLLTSLLTGESPATTAFSDETLLTVLAAALSAFSLTEALDRATRPPMVAVEGRSLIAGTIRIGVALLLVLHLLWLLYVSRIF